jgi:hypothetical protein
MVAAETAEIASSSAKQEPTIYPNNVVIRQRKERKKPSEPRKQRPKKTAPQPAKSSSVNTEPSISEQVAAEFGLVFRAWIFVLRSWIELPVKLPGILSEEALRLWDYWLGFQVRPRTWKIAFPSRDEL